MKLFELYADLDDIQDPLQRRDNQDANYTPIDKASVEAERKAQTPRRNSNVGKAKRIANKIKMHKRQSNPIEDETHHQSNIGGHVSSFLFR